MKAPKLKKGMRVTIYSDPLTRKKSEGVAQLVKCIDREFGVYNGRVIERWEVSFEENGYMGEPVERDVIPAPGIVEG